MEAFSHAISYFSIQKDQSQYFHFQGQHKQRVAKIQNKLSTGSISTRHK